MIAIRLAALLALACAALVAQSPADCLMHGGDARETRFSPLNQINSGNASRLGVAWTWDTGTLRGLEATPIVADGVLYASTSWSVVHAIDARTGQMRWKWDPEVARSYGQRACCDVVNRGVALHQGKVYASVLDGRLAALDARTGKLLWLVRTTEPGEPYTITGAPRVVKGKVIIGNGGSEYGVRGYFSAYDAASGKLVWRFYTVPGDPSKPFESPALERAAKTWTGEWWKMGGGGTVWDSFAYDAEADLLYAGTGNGSPWNRNVRSPGGGDNLYLSSILALRPDSGELVWHYQTTPGDTWDYTATQHMILTDLMIGGRLRKVLMQAPKNGFFYVLDRITGELISAEAFGKMTWATGVDKKTGRPIEVPEARYKDQMVLVWPGPFGAHNWQPMSWNPATGLVYIPAHEEPFPYSPDAQFRFRKGGVNLGVTLPPADETAPPGQGFLLAWDPVAQKERWRAPNSGVNSGGTLSTAGNLVFQGTADGRFVAYSADRGQKLWEVNLGTGVIAAPVTYQLDGQQYVSILAGWGGAYSMLGGNASGAYKTPGRLWTFSLDGKQQLVAVKSQPRPLPTPIAFQATPERIQKGMVLYSQACVFCHGVAASSGGVISDLRYSGPQVFRNYRGIVLDGEYTGMGMPAFRDALSADDVEAIRLFVLSQRAKLTARK